MTNTPTNNGNCSISGYQLEYSNSSWGTYVALTSPTYSSLSYSLTTGFAPGTSIYFRVAHVNIASTSGAALSDYSNSLTVQTD